jgi:hypothetical protein
MKKLLLLVLATVTLLLSTSAFAQSSKADIEKLKTSADEAMDNLHYDAAFAGYKQAYALSHDPRFLYNMGRAAGAMGDYPEALDELEKFRLDAPADLRARVPQLEQLIADFKKHVSTLAIQSNVAGARVVVRQKEVGRTPMGELRVNAGPAEVEVVADDYVADRRNVTLPEGGRLDLNVELVKASPFGILVVRSTPAASSVLVDGVGKSGTPLEVSLMPGSHSLLLSREGFHDLSASAIVERGVRRELDFKLEKTPGVLSRWWFWTVVGVVVVAAASAVTTAVVCTSTTACERAPDVGTIAPGTLRGP